jgi:hypothetical protein
VVRNRIERQSVLGDGQVAVRNAEATDLNVNDLDYGIDFDVDVDRYPYTILDSTQGLLACAFYHEYITLL